MINMRKIFVLTAVVSTVFASCIAINAEIVRASGNIVTRDLDGHTAFTKIKLSGSHDVEYTQSTDGTTSVSITGPDNILDIMDVRTNDGKLTVSTKRGYSIVGLDESVKVRATSPSPLGSVEIAGSGDMTLSGIVTTEEFKGEIAGSGDLDIENLVCTRADIKIAGSGDVDIEYGKASVASFNIAGSGGIEANDFRAANVKAKIAGSGNIACHATESLKVSVAGSGDIYYHGNPPIVESSVAGSGKIYKR